MKNPIRYIGIIMGILWAVGSYGQIITGDLEVIDTTTTVIQVAGVEKLNIDSNGATVSGKLQTQTLDVSGNTKVNGMLEAPNGVRTNSRHYEFSRWVGIGTNSHHDFLFTTDYSAGFTIEVTLSGNFGPLASTMTSRKHVINYYQYGSDDYRNDNMTVYSMGSLYGWCEAKVIPTGNNQFVVRVYNYHDSYSFGTTILVDIVTRANPSLTLN